MNKRIRRSSPAMTVAITSLIVAVAGTAVATPIAVKSLNKKEKKVIKKIARNKANQAIDQRAPGLSVASANSAGNADSVDGHHAACPGGYVAVAGVCYASPPRPLDDWFDATDDCADENASLPTVGQLHLARDELGNVSAGGEWTDSLHFDGTTRAYTVSDAGSEVTLAAGSNSRVYRCVTRLVR